MPDQNLWQLFRSMQSAARLVAACAQAPRGVYELSKG